MKSPERKVNRESPRSFEVRKALKDVVASITAETIDSEQLLPETKMRILESLRVRPKDVTQALWDSSKSYEGMSTEMQIRSYLHTRIDESVGSIVATNRNKEEAEAFRKFLMRSVVGINV